MNDDDPQPIECRAAVEISPTATNEILFLPIGLHAITPVSGGIGRPIKVQVGPDTAQAIERQRNILAGSGKRPYFDFNHEDGPASFWPEYFTWRNGQGVMAHGEWSKRGRNAVEGKDYRAFSPVFHVDNKRAEAATVVCKETADPNMGGLVNNPAFKDLPLWAKNAESLGNAGATGDNEGKKGETKMSNEEVAALRAKQTELEAEVAALKAANEDQPRLTLAEQEVRAVNAELEAEELRAENARNRDIIMARNKTEAENAVKAAVQRGAILPKDDKTKQDFIRRATADPSFLIAIAAMQGGGNQLTTRITGGTSRITVQDEDPGAIFGSMARINSTQRKCRTIKDKFDCSREFAAIYSAEFSDESSNRKRLFAFPMDRLEDAIAAADVTDSDLGTLSGTLVTQRTLELLRFKFPSLAMFTTDFSGESAQFGQTIMTRTVQIPAVVDYNTTTGWATGIDAPNTTDVPVTINKHKGVPISFNEQIMASTVRRLFDEQAPAQAYALAKQMVDDLYANITDANFVNNTVVTTANFLRSNVVDIGIGMDLLGVPDDGRTLLLYPTVFGSLEKDPVMTTWGNFQDPRLMTGPTPNAPKFVINVETFQVVKAPNLPTNNANLTGFAGTKSALLIASRLPNDYTRFAPGVAFGNVQTVTDPDLGLSVMLNQFTDNILATGNQRISLMYGTAAGDGAQGYLLKAHTGSGSSRTS